MKLILWACFVFIPFITPSPIKRDIDAHLKKIKPSHNVGIKIISLDTNKVLYKKNDHTQFIPASSIKLVTSIVALELLGPHYRFTTTLLTDGKIIGNELRGNLYLKGSGDPSLTSAHLCLMAKQLRKQGIKKITGNIILDASVFDTQLNAPGWVVDGSYWKLPASGLTLNHNYISNTKTAIKNPVRYAGNQLNTCLRKFKISLKKKLLVKKIDKPCTILALHASKPLHELISIVLKDSDNLYADCIFKALGARYNKAGSWEAATHEIQNFLTKTVHLNSKNFIIADGSGLSRKNKFTPHQFIELLVWSYNHSNNFSYLFDGLPQPGIDGTLKRRRIRTAHSSTLHAKTGTLDNVSSLVGFCINKNKKPLVFALMANGPHINYKRQFEDPIARTLLKNHSELS